MDPFQLVGYGDVDDSLADEGGCTGDKTYLPEEGEERNKHARKASNDDPEDDGEGKHGVADVQEKCSKTNKLCYNLQKDYCQNPNPTLHNLGWV